MPIRIEPSVWDAWAVNDDDEPSIELILRGSDDEDAVRGALMEILEEAERADPDAFVGEWDHLRVPEGMMLRVEEPDDLERSLAALVQALERRGVNGRIEPYAALPIPPHPQAAPLLQCVIHVPALQRGGYGDADRTAMRTVLETAAAWCVDSGRRGAPVLAAGVLPPIRLSRDEDALGRLVAGMDGVTRLWTLSSGVLRLVGLEPWTCVLVETFATGGWRPAYEGLKGCLRALAGPVGYGYVSRGSDVTAAAMRYALDYDWPQRPAAQRLGPAPPSLAWQGRFAPDAFPLQLLGRELAGRLPASDRWRREPIADGATLLEHGDLPAWLDEPFVPLGATRWPRAEGWAPPPLLRQAREDLDAIIFDPRRDLAG